MLTIASFTLVHFSSVSLSDASLQSIVLFPLDHMYASRSLMLMSKRMWNKTILHDTLKVLIIIDLIFILIG